MLDYTPEVLAPIVAEAVRCYPSEACGAVVGTPPCAVAMENQYDRYHALDPATFPRTSRTAYKLNELKLARIEEEEGLRAIWHSHCDAGAYFSAEDSAVALGGGDAPLWPGVEYLVISIERGRPVAARAFLWDGRGFAGRDVPLTEGA